MSKAWVGMVTCLVGVGRFGDNEDFVRRVAC